jgi:phosphohistidine phosphatase
MSFEIYLVRHGLAGQFGDYEDDAVRPLTEEGQKKTRKVAQRLLDLGVTFDRIYTSPYQRALQTAEILQSVGLGPTIEPSLEPVLEPALEIYDQLQPEGDRAAVIDRLTSVRSSVRQLGLRVAMVGHEPDLSQLAATLVFGQPSENLTLKKAGIIGLTAPIEGQLVGACQLFWLAPPRLLLG